MAAPGFQYFTSSDAGAPVLSATAGRMIAVLDWALVGKGGWQKAFSGTNLAAYRSLSGNRFYLRVDDTQTTFARIRGYRNMTAVSTGTNLFPTTGVAASAGWGAPKSDGSGAASRRYWGVRTNRFIMLFVETGDLLSATVRSRSFFAFGDVPTLCELDTFNTVIVGSDTPNDNLLRARLANQPTPTNFYSESAGPHMAASPSGNVSAVGASLYAGFASYSGTYATPPMGSDVAGRLQYSPIQIFSSNAVAGSPGNSIARALLPNLYHGYGPLQRDSYPDLVPFTYESRQFMPIMHQIYDPSLDGSGNYSDGYVLIDLTDSGVAL